MIVHDLKGETRNCGCSGGSLGGINHLAALRDLFPTARLVLTGTVERGESSSSPVVGPALAPYGWDIAASHVLAPAPSTMRGFFSAGGSSLRENRSMDSRVGQDETRIVPSTRGQRRRRSTGSVARRSFAGEPAAGWRSGPRQTCVIPASYPRHTNTRSMPPALARRT